MTPHSETSPALNDRRPSVINLLASAKKLDAKLLKNEPEVSAIRWPEYTGDPISLNFKFAQAYGDVFRDKFRERVDYRGARGVRGIDLAPFLGSAMIKDKSGVVQAVHRVRQIADATGLPYPVFIRFCFNFHSRSRKYMPRPNQLIPKDEFIPAFERELDKFIEERGELLLKSYRARNPDIAAVSLPSCLGVVGARDESTLICSACPYLARCAEFGDEIAALVSKAKTESGKPITLVERKRAQATERKRKSRALKSSKKLPNVEPSHLNIEQGWTI